MKLKFIFKFKMLFIVFCFGCSPNLYVTPIGGIPENKRLDPWLSIDIGKPLSLDKIEFGKIENTDSMISIIGNKEAWIIDIESKKVVAHIFSKSLITSKIWKFGNRMYLISDRGPSISCYDLIEQEWKWHSNEAEKFGRKEIGLGNYYEYEFYHSDFDPALSREIQSAASRGQVSAVTGDVAGGVAGAVTSLIGVAVLLASQEIQRQNLPSYPARILEQPELRLTEDSNYLIAVGSTIRKHEKFNWNDQANTLLKINVNTGDVVEIKIFPIRDKDVYGNRNLALDFQVGTIEIFDASWNLLETIKMKDEDRITAPIPQVSNQSSRVDPKEMARHTEEMRSIHKSHPYVYPAVDGIQNSPFSHHRIIKSLINGDVITIFISNWKRALNLVNGYPAPVLGSPAPFETELIQYNIKTGERIGKKISEWNTNTIFSASKDNNSRTLLKLAKYNNSFGVQLSGILWIDSAGVFKETDYFNISDSILFYEDRKLDAASADSFHLYRNKGNSKMYYLKYSDSASSFSYTIPETAIKTIQSKNYLAEISSMNTVLREVPYNNRSVRIDMTEIKYLFVANSSGHDFLMLIGKNYLQEEDHLAIIDSRTYSVFGNRKIGITFFPWSRISNGNIFWAISQENKNHFFSIYSLPGGNLIKNIPLSYYKNIHSYTPLVTEIADNIYVLTYADQALRIYNYTYSH